MTRQRDTIECHTILEIYDISMSIRDIAWILTLKSVGQNVYSFNFIVLFTVLKEFQFLYYFLSEDKTVSKSTESPDLSSVA